METNVTTKGKIPEGSITQRRLAMEAMVTAAKAMIKASEESGYFSLPEEYKLIAERVQEFVEWKKSREFKIAPRTLEELI